MKGDDFMAKTINLIGKKVGKLTVTSVVPKELRPTQTHGNYWYCKCECGNTCMVPTTYLSGNSNYVQTSCGCDRKKRAFQSSAIVSVDDTFLDLFKEDFERYMFIHKQLVRTSGENSSYYKDHPEEYKEAILYFWHNEQFNKLYDFWQQNLSKSQTFYDLYKPSLNHIIPKSKGGSNHYSNLQFLTLFENLCKRDMTPQEWQNFKENTKTSSILFI